MAAIIWREKTKFHSLHLQHRQKPDPKAQRAGYLPNIPTLTHPARWLERARVPCEATYQPDAGGSRVGKKAEAVVSAVWIKLEEEEQLSIFTWIGTIQEDFRNAAGREDVRESSPNLRRENAAFTWGQQAEAWTRQDSHIGASEKEIERARLEAVKSSRW